MYAMSRKGIMGIGNHISQKRVKFPEQPCQAKYFWSLPNTPLEHNIFVLLHPNVNVMIKKFEIQFRYSLSFRCKQKQPHHKKCSNFFVEGIKRNTCFGKYISWEGNKGIALCINPGDGEI